MNEQRKKVRIPCPDGIEGCAVAHYRWEDELPNPRPEVNWFAKQMELKLRANDHKRHWSEVHLDYLIDRLFQEANELWRAIQNGEPAANIVKEAADVANFAMMIADNAERQAAPVDESRVYGNDCPRGSCDV